MKKFEILDTTIRDGSYAINFTFTALDVYNIVKDLDQVGVKYIEVGHGVGFNAKKMGYTQAVESDEAYLEAANSAVTNAKYGMFCIVNVARLSDLKMAAKHNMGFVRIGADVSKIDEMEAYIKTAKDYGMTVMANFMKSYVLSPEALAEKALLAESFGAEAIYVVDSAGGMFPHHIRDYYNAIRKVSNVPLGFHGHNNLGLAIANSLEAVECGYGFIDSTLQGLGRSAGNAATEVLVAALEKQGYNTKIELLELLEIGQKYIQPLIDLKGSRILDTIAGYSEFHSSYMGHIHKYAAKYSVDPAKLIIEMAKIDKVNLDEAVLDKIAKELKKEAINLGKYDFRKYVGGEQDEL